VAAEFKNVAFLKADADLKLLAKRADFQSVLPDAEGQEMSNPAGATRK
jgi:hypothetical protein